jgi:hypothetical protein
MFDSILTLIKLGFLIAIAIVFGLILIGLLGTVIGYFYSRKIYSIGNDLVRWALQNKPEEIYKMLNDDGKRATSLEEVVFLCETFSTKISLDQNVDWDRAHVKKRKGFATLNGHIKGIEGQSYIISLHFKRSRSYIWKISSLRFAQDHSHPVTL